VLVAGLYCPLQPTELTHEDKSKDHNQHAEATLDELAGWPVEIAPHRSKNGAVGDEHRGETENKEDGSEQGAVLEIVAIGAG